METTVENAIDQIKSAKQLKPVYLLTGEENYLIDKVCEYIEDNLVPADFRDFDQKVVYGRDVNMREVVNLAKQYPMMSPLKVVIVKEAQDIQVKEWDLLTTYLEHPSPVSVIVFCYRNKKLDKRTAVYKAIDKNGQVFEQKSLKEGDIARWIALFLQSKGYTITERSAMMIASSIGNDRTKLVQEFEKVFVTLPQGSVVTDDVVERYMGISKEYNIFELQDAIGQRNIEKCSRIVNYFASNPKANPIQMVIPMLYRYLVSLMMYIQDPSQITNSYIANKYAIASRNYSLPKLATRIGYLHQADLMSKGVGNANTVSEGDILKELIFKITH